MEQCFWPSTPGTERRSTDVKFPYRGFRNSLCNDPTFCPFSDLLLNVKFFVSLLNPDFKKISFAKLRGSFFFSPRLSVLLWTDLKEFDSPYYSDRTSDVLDNDLSTSVIPVTFPLIWKYYGLFLQVVNHLPHLPLSRRFTGRYIPYTSVLLLKGWGFQLSRW